MRLGRLRGIGDEGRECLGVGKPVGDRYCRAARAHVAVGAERFGGSGSRGCGALCGRGGRWRMVLATLCGVVRGRDAGGDRPVGTARDSGRDRRARLRASVVNRQTAILTCGGPRGGYCGRAVRSGDLLRGRDNAGRVDRFLGLVAPVGVDGIGWYGAVEGWVYGSAGRRDFTGRFPGVVRRSRGFDMGGARRWGAESGVVVFRGSSLWYWLR